MSQFSSDVGVIFGIIFLAVFIWWRHNSPAAKERKAREHTHALYQQVLRLTTDRPLPDPAELAADVVNKLPELPYDVALTFGEVAYGLLSVEHPPGPPEPPLICNSMEGAAYRDTLSSFARKVTPRSAETTRAIIRVAFTDLLADLPSLTSSSSDELTFNTTLSAALPNFGEVLEQFILTFYAEEAQPFFQDLRKKIDINLHEVSGFSYPAPADKQSKMVMPSKYKGENIQYAYCKDTPLLQLFDIHLPISIPQKTRFEHTLILGGTGAGKTQLLQSMILHDLQQDEPPAIVVVDSQGEMIPKLAKLQHWNDVAADSLIILDPRDNPALNLFDVNQQRLSRYSSDQQEQVYNHTQETFSYLLNSIVGAKLTVKQSVLFDNLIALMLALPKAMGRCATLLDLINVMVDPTPYGAAIDTLSPVTRDFFTRDFGESQYNQTKEQVRYRLQAILANKTLSRLFLAPRNTVDFFEELNKGTTILIDTSKAFLGAKNSAYLGRVAITLVLQAILERAAHGGYKRPVFLFVDEAKEYFDQSIDTFLTEARKQNAGLIIANQHLTQMTSELRASVAADTSIKFSSGASNLDARALASDMRTTPQFLLDQPVLTFACYIKGTTPQAVPISVELLKLENEPMMDDENYKLMRAKNRARVSLPDMEQPQTVEPEPTDPSNPDISSSDEW